jgi:hypothetical protein
MQGFLWNHQSVRLLLVIFLLNATIGQSVFAQTTDNPSPVSPSQELPVSDGQTMRWDPVTGAPYQAPLVSPEIPLLDQQSGLLELNRPVFDPNASARAGFSCSQSQLDPNERQRLWDETLKKGFVGKELGSGTPAKNFRDSLDQNNVIIPDEQGKLAVKQQIPNQMIDPEEIAHLLNNYQKGAFTFGILLPDSLRAGRCKDLNSGCALLGKNLALRNSGKGIVENYVNVWNDLKTWAKFDEPGSSVPGLSKEQLDAVQSELAFTSEIKQLPVKTAERTPGKLIPNSILSETFSSSMNSNCTSASCTINTYSMFDKMFNAYSSGSMLLTTFGPSILNQAQRALGYYNRRWMGGVVPSFNSFQKAIKSQYMLPDSWYTKWIMNRQYNRVRSKALGFDNNLVGNRRVLEGGGFDGWWTPAYKKELEPITDPVKRGEYYDYFKAWQHYGHSNELARQLAEEEYKTAIDGLDPTNPLVIAAKKKFAQKTARLWRDIDDFTGLDVPQWHLQHKSVNWHKYAVKTHTGDYVQPAIDSDYYDAILKKFEDAGHLGFTKEDLAKYNISLENANGKLALYTVEPQGEAVSKITRDTLEDALSKGNLGNMYARLDNEEFVPLTSQNMEYILKKTTGDVEVFRGGYKKTREMSAEELADFMLSGRGYKPIKSLARNADTMVATLRENGWQYRQHWGSLLDRYFAQNNQLLKTYLSIKGGAKLTVYPFAFWGFKRGFGQEALSLYQLPDSWTTLEISHKDSALFDNSFIDFFANEGSDQGDIFVALLNKLPWKMVLDKLSEEYNPVNEFYQTITHNELRNETGNLAVYSSSPQTCSNCSLSIQSKDFKTFSPFFSSPQSMNSFVLEDTPANQKDVGQTLIAFAYHANLNGNTKDIDNEGNGIDLEEGIRNQETCQDLVTKMNQKVPVIGWIAPDLLPKSAGGAALTLVFGETLGYAVFTWAGFLGSAYQQILLAPQLQDCVDTQEGYFVHFFAPAAKKEAEKDKESSTNLNTTKVSEAIQQGSDQLLSAFQGQTENWTGKAAEETKQKINSLVQNAETKDLVEAVLKTNGVTTGQFSGSHLFYLWLEGGTELTPSSYRTEGKEEIKDGNITVTNDLKEGKVKVNGQPVITDPDVTRLATTNTAIPAIEYPNSITKIGLPSNQRSLVFRMNSQAHTLVVEPDVLDCIRQGVMAQTGVGMQFDDLTEVFGPTNAVITDTHPNIYAQPEMERIVGEGIPRKVAEGRNAYVDIFSNSETELVPSLDGDNNVGHLKSIQFQNGVIIYKPSTNELIVWLKRNAKTTMNQNEVAGLNAKPSSSPNPLTNCSEPAIDLSVAGDSTSEQAMLKAEQFNQSLQYMGPFKIFDTPTKRFIFYSGPAPECKPMFKIIDKQTGETLVDQPIKSIEATPDGVRVTTEDGKTHDLGFSSENGKPILTYNGQPEPLLSAQGDKGAFWYDPEKGLWYTENAQLLPLLEAFRSNGISTQVGPDGKVTSTASGNVLNLSVGSGKEGTFNLPSLPEQPLVLAVFLVCLVGALVFLYTREFKPKKN